MWSDDPYARKPNATRSYLGFVIWTCVLWLFPVAMIAIGGSFYAEALVKPPLWKPLFWQWDNGGTVGFVIDGLLVLSVFAGVIYCLCLRRILMLAVVMSCGQAFVAGSSWLILKSQLTAFYL
jgi:hypothetical protein